MLDMSAKETSSHMYLYDHGKAVMDARSTQSSLGHAMCAREPSADGRDAEIWYMARVFNARRSGLSK